MSSGSLCLLCLSVSCPLFRSYCSLEFGCSRSRPMRLYLCLDFTLFVHSLCSFSTLSVLVTNFSKIGPFGFISLELHVRCFDNPYPFGFSRPAGYFNGTFDLESSGFHLARLGLQFNRPMQQRFSPCTYVTFRLFLFRHFEMKY